MGNSHLTGLRHSDGDHSISYQVQLKSATIDFPRRKTKQETKGVSTESWEVSYTVGKSTCKLALTKTKGRPDHVGSMNVKIVDDEESKDRSVTVKTAQAETSRSSDPDMHSKATSISLVVSDTMRNPTTTTTKAQGSVTETKFDLYESKGWKGLIICQWKKKSEHDKNPYMGTVIHYYARNDVGLSLAIKRIRVSDDGHLDFAVDGPKQHPFRALSYLFDEVKRTGTWKPTYCPHCANNIIERLLASFGLSASEDIDDDNVAAAMLRGRGSNAGCLVANGGVFEGDNNGCLNISL